MGTTVPANVPATAPTAPTPDASEKPERAWRRHIREQAGADARLIDWWHRVPRSSSTFAARPRSLPLQNAPADLSNPARTVPSLAPPANDSQHAPCFVHVSFASSANESDPSGQLGAPTGEEERKILRIQRSRPQVRRSRRSCSWSQKAAGLRAAEAPWIRSAAAKRRWAFRGPLGMP